MIRISRFGVRVITFVVVLAVLLAGYHLGFIQALDWEPLSHKASSTTDADHTSTSIELPCQQLRGGDDVVVVMRTGATEILDKLPVHFKTTFRCFPDKIIFSDYAETFNGHQVYDVLAEVNDTTKQTNYDFLHYYHLQSLGREGLNRSELSGTHSYESGPVGKNDNDGWRLDKWKFLPMIVQTLKLRPDKKWYVFVEPDSYLVWSNLLKWLEELDPAAAVYYGSEVQIGKDIFAHGGSVFVMSNSAMQKGMESYLSESEEWHARTSHHWAGDCILGTALAKAGVPLTWSWPMFQGGNPVEMDWTQKKGRRRLWCTPAMSYHHLDPVEIQGMWDFEQRRLAGVDRGVLHHQEVFKSHILPNLATERSNWTNISPDLLSYTNRHGLNTTDCRALCDQQPDCVQYALGPIGCSLSSSLKLGHTTPGVESGWMFDRIEEWSQKLSNCEGRDGWIK